MNTCFQRTDKNIAELLRDKIKTYFTESSLYSTLKKSDILLIKNKTKQNQNRPPELIRFFFN